MTTNLINGKIYIGQHQGKQFDIKYFGSGDKIRYAIKKYGKNNFVVGILHKCNKNKCLEKWEKYYIDYYDSTDPKIGYNISYGGEAFMRDRRQSEEAKAKISLASKGNKYRLNKPVSKETRLKMSNSKKNTHRTEETKNKISKSHIGIPAWNKGVPRTDEEKSKISIGNKCKHYYWKGKHLSDEHKNKIGFANSHPTIETRIKKSNSAKKRVHTKEQHEKIIASKRKHGYI